MRLALLLLPVCLCAQTTVQLRTGDHQSMYRITALTSATPAVVTVKNWQGLTQHDLANGTTIFIHGVPGCQNANGYAKVISGNQGAGTFALTTTADVNFTCVEAYDTGGGPYTWWQSGFLGKVETYTLQPSPRIMTPQTGAVRTRMIDPDYGVTNTASVAGGVDAANPPWAGLLAKLAAKAAACCSEATTFLRGLTNSGDQNAMEGQDAVQAATVWAADNSKTTYLDLAKYHLNNVEMMYEDGGSNGRPGFAFDSSAPWGGLGSGTDWLSIAIQNVGRAYDLIKNQPEALGGMSAAEKTTFRQKMLNGFDGPCTNQMAETPTGVASVTSGSKIVTGTNLAGYVAGGWIYIKTTHTWNSTGVWYKVLSVQSDTQLTIDTNASATIASKNHHLISPWTTSSCGMLRAALSHAYSNGPHFWTPSTGAIDADDTSVTVTYVSGFPAPPFYVYWGAEAVNVTAIVDHTLTIERGKLYSTAISHASGTRMLWSQNIVTAPAWTLGPYAVNGNWTHNLHHMKILGNIMVGLALADEEPRAKTLFQDSFNYYYDLIYTYNKDLWSGTTHGGISYGYRWGRWNGPLVQLGAAAEYAFDRPNSIFGSYSWGITPAAFYLTNPDSWIDAIYDTTQQTAQYSASHIGPWLAAAQTFNSGQAETAWGNYYYRNLSGLYTEASFSGQTGSTVAPFAMAFMTAADTSTDFRPVAPPWKFFTDNAYDYNKSTGATDTYYGLVTSKSDWTSTATYLHAWLGVSDTSDHLTGDQPQAPGAYGIKRGSKTLLSDNYDNGICQGCGSVSLTNHVEITGIRTSGTQPSWAVNNVSTGDGGQQNIIDRKIGNADYVYARGNFTASYQASVGMTRRHRGILHWKRTPEMVAVFDNTAMTSARNATTRLHYYRQGETGTNSIFSRTSNAISFKKTAGATPAMVTTQVLFPDAQTPTVTSPTITDGFTAGCTTYACVVTIAWTTVTAAQMIAVHFPSAGTSATLPATTNLTGLDAGSVGFETDNSNTSRAAVFSKTGALRTTAEFSTLFAGNGYCFATDLTAGTYDVARGGSAHAGNPFTVTAGEHSMEFSCDGAAAYTVTQSGAAPACVITTTSLTGGTVSTAYSQTATTNCTSPTWSVLSGALPTSLSINSGSGAITGTPTVAGNFAFTLQVVGTENTATKALSIDISGADTEALAITDTVLEIGYRGLAYSVGLSATGGTAPYTWTLTTPSTCGITITTAGVLTGIPTALGICSLAVRVTDSLAVTADLAMELNVIGVVIPRFTGGARVSGGVRAGQ